MADRKPELPSMKILQVASGLHGWAGIEKYVLYLDEGLTERGHELLVTVSPQTPMAKALKGRGIEISVRDKFDLRALAAYIRLFRAKQFDIVHTHFNPDFNIVAWAAKLTSRPPLVMTRHVALPWPKIKARNFSMLYDRIIPVSDASRVRLRQSGVPDKIMRIAKAGCPPLQSSVTRSAMRASLGLGDEFAVAYIGRLTREKGIAVLLDAAKNFKTEISLNVFGNGPLSESVERFAAENEFVRYRGFRTDIPDCLAAMDLVVIPSIWEEAFPYAALEAMSIGLPIVASHIGGLPELVLDEVSGLLVRPGDANDLVLAVNRLASDSELCSRLGMQGQNLQRSEFTIAKMAERIEGVYLELGKSPSP